MVIPSNYSIPIIIILCASTVGMGTLWVKASEKAAILSATVEAERSNHNKTKQAYSEYVSNAKKNMDRLNSNLKTLTQEYDKANRKARELEKKFSEHEIKKMAERHPIVLQNIFNRGTKEAIQRVEARTREFSK